MQKITLEILNKVCKAFDICSENHDLGEKFKELVGQECADKINLEEKFRIMGLLGYCVDEYGEMNQI
jgi:hypothetical protein